MAKAYFDCVNDNGGINGRPIQYTLYTEQLDPAQEAALAKKLSRATRSSASSATRASSSAERTGKYYEQKGYLRHRRRRRRPSATARRHIVEVNMGPRYSNVGAAQALVKAGVKKLAIASPDTISAYADGGPANVAQAAGHPVQDLPDPPAGHGRDVAAAPDVPVRR